MPWNDPLLPQSAIQPAQQALERPSLTRSPGMARLRGFGAGALEGLRSLTTPTNIASMASLAVPVAGEARALAGMKTFAPEAIQGLFRAIPEASRVAEAVPPAVQAVPRAAMPLWDAKEAAQQLMKGWAGQTVKEAAALRGTPGDIPQNPLAQALEAARRGVQ